MSRRSRGPVTRRFVHRPKEVVVRKGRNVEEIKKKISVRLPDSTLEERKRIFDELLKRYGYWTVRTLGSDLVHESGYDGDGLWICRSACYTPLSGGRAVKPTHHGYPVNRHRDFGLIIENNLENPEKINQCSKRSLVTPRTSLRTGKPVGAAAL